MDHRDDSIWLQSADAWLQGSERDAAAHTSLQVSRLGAAEQFVLSHLRLWWHADSACARVLVRNGFTAAGLSSSHHTSFIQFLGVLAAAAQPLPTIHTAPQPEVSGDEARLLGLVALCQQGHNGHAIMVLKRWLPPTAYRVSLKNVVAFAAALTKEGLLLAPPIIPRTSARSGPRLLVH
jgi:hypothetical protein